jgi:hypothetical protein
VTSPTAAIPFSRIILEMRFFKKLALAAFLTVQAQSVEDGSALVKQPRATWRELLQIMNVSVVDNVNAVLISFFRKTRTIRAPPSSRGGRKIQLPAQLDGDASRKTNL